MSQTTEALERIRDLPNEELVQALDRARDELFRLNLGLHTNQVENTMTVRAKRREVAKILTVIRAREIGLEIFAGIDALDVLEPEGAIYFYARLTDDGPSLEVAERLLTDGEWPAYRASRSDRPAISASTSRSKKRTCARAWSGCAPSSEPDPDPRPNCQLP